MVGVAVCSQAAVLIEAPAGRVLLPPRISCAVVLCLLYSGCAGRWADASLRLYLFAPVTKEAEHLLRVVRPLGFPSCDVSAQVQLPFSY